MRDELLCEFKEWLLLLLEEREERDCCAGGWGFGNGFEVLGGGFGGEGWAAGLGSLFLDELESFLLSYTKNADKQGRIQKRI